MERVQSKYEGKSVIFTDHFTTAKKIKSEHRSPVKTCNGFLHLVIFSSPLLPHYKLTAKTSHRVLLLLMRRNHIIKPFGSHSKHRKVLRSSGCSDAVASPVSFCWYLEYRLNSCQQNCLIKCSKWKGRKSSSVQLWAYSGYICHQRSHVVPCKQLNYENHTLHKNALISKCTYSWKLPRGYRNV